MTKFDLITKEFVKSYSFNDIFHNRSDKKNNVINGRTHIILGTNQAIGIVGNLYRMFDPSVESYKYLLLVGVGMQDVNNPSIINEDDLYELACINAVINPTLVMNLDKELSEDNFLDLSIVLNSIIDKEFLKTKEELNIIDL